MKYLFTAKSRFFWRKIFNIIKEYLFKANSALTNISQNNIGEKIAIDSEALYRTKTFVRLTEYAVENNISIDKPVFTITEDYLHYTI